MKSIVANPCRLISALLLCSPALFPLSIHAVAAAEREAPPMREVQEIPLPGVQGRLDHFTIDAKRKRVIFSGLGNNSVQIVDAFAGKMIHQIDGLSQPQGTFYPADNDRLYVANATDGHVNIHDGTKFNKVDATDFGEDPDNRRYHA